MKSIQFTLAPARLPPLKDEHKYVAHVHLRGSLGFDDVAERILGQGSTVTKPDLLAVFENLAVCLQELLVEGWRVNFGGIFSMYASVHGTFPDAMATFDPASNTVELNAQAGRRLRDYVLANAVPERIHVDAPAPKPLEFKDLSSATINAVITPGNIGTVEGLHLRFDPEAADEGIFLIPAAGGDTVQITVTQRNDPSQLVFLVPTLTPHAEYWLEVRAHLKGGEALRAGRLVEPLEVAPLP